MALLERRSQAEEVKDYRAGMICAVIANLLTGKGKKYKPQDFMPHRGDRKQTWQEMLAVVESVNTMMQGSTDA